MPPGCSWFLLALSWLLLTPLQAYFTMYKTISHVSFARHYQVPCRGHVKQKAEPRPLEMPKPIALQLPRCLKERKEVALVILIRDFDSLKILIICIRSAGAKSVMIDPYLGNETVVPEVGLS